MLCHLNGVCEHETGFPGFSMRASTNDCVLHGWKCSALQNRLSDVVWQAQVGSIMKVCMLV